MTGLPEDLVKLLTAYDRFDFVGSCVSCDPAPTDTDCDILCLVKNIDVTISDLQAIAFILDGSCVLSHTQRNNPDLLTDTGMSEPRQQFWSLKRGDYNLILTADPDFYDKFMLATRIATNLNLLKKDDRITLFQAILYGNG